MAKRVVSIKMPDLDFPVNMKTLGQMVRFKRTQMGMTIETAASICRVSKQAYSNVEHGQKSVNAETVIKILACLGITLWFDQKSDNKHVGENDEWL